MHTREFVSHNLPIYKLGRSHHLDNRIKQYPNGSNVVCALPCKTSIMCEQLLLHIFKTKFIHKKIYGNEYFEGDYELMVSTVIDILFTNKDKILDTFTKMIEDKKLRAKEKEKEKQKVKGNKKVKQDKTKKEKQILCCPKCNLIFTYPSKLKIHFSQSYHCKKNIDEIKTFFAELKDIKKDDDTICNICEKSFSRKDSYTRHKKLNKCKIMP